MKRKFPMVFKKCMVIRNLQNPENTPVMESFSYSCEDIDVPFYNLQLLFKVILCVSDAYLELFSTSVMELFCGSS